MDIKISKGLDVPLKGKPSGEIRQLPEAKKIALNLAHLSNMRFRLHVHLGDKVTLGQPLIEDKGCPGRMFLSPAAGVVEEIRRGEKRRITDIVIAVAEVEERYLKDKFDVAVVSRQELIEYFLGNGLFAHIHQRPFNILADPRVVPRAIFVKGVDSAPYCPLAELQVMGYERAFQCGLDALNKLTEGAVHLVYKKGSPCKAFTDAKGVEKHTVRGVHPFGNQSVHIHFIDPIKSIDDIVWTLHVYDVVVIGRMLLEGCYHTERLLSIAGNGIVPGKQGYFQGRMGYPVGQIVADKVVDGSVRLISGDVLMGSLAAENDFLGFHHYGCCAVPEEEKRPFLHFFRPRSNDFSFHRIYSSGCHKRAERLFDFDTRLHGEVRPFIDGAIYDKVMPMRIPTAFFIKALLSGDWELSEQLGLFEVDSEDFALATFICPSKINMVDIVRRAQDQYVAENS